MIAALIAVRQDVRPHLLLFVARLDLEVDRALLNHDLVYKHHVVRSHHQIPPRAERANLEQHILHVEVQGPTGARPLCLDRPPPHHLIAAISQPQVF